MSSSTSPAVQNGQPSQGVWQALAPYVVPPLAASVAIVPIFRDMIAKSALQKGEEIPRKTVLEGLTGGLRVSPTVGIIVGTQMVFQNFVEKAMVGESKKASLSSTLVSSAIVGTASAPILAVFNGQTMGWSVKESLLKFSPRQGIAIALQETAFVGGLSLADRAAVVMKRKFGNNRFVECTAAFMAGFAGSLAGHPANTALTRWQSGMTIDSPRQLMWGAIRKARAMGVFSVVYKFGKEALNSTVESSR